MPRFVVLAALTLACGPSQNAPVQPTDTAPVADRQPAEKAPAGVQVLPFEADMVPPEVRVEGTVVDGLHWTDARGRNLVVFSATTREHKASGETQFGFSDDVTSVYLYVVHYTRVSDSTSYRLVGRVAQADENCDGDTATRFKKESFEVTDLDVDGVGEAGFAYFSEGCRTDVSPSVFKLFLLEDGVKRVLRGASHFPSAGDPPAEPSSRTGLDDAPPAFVDHLQERWKTLSGEF